MLRYYEATQKNDPRGAIRQFVDRHEQDYQLFHTTGEWWEGTGSLRIAADDLPPTFREALTRRKEDPIAIGWPLGLRDLDGVPTVLPLGLLSAEAVLADGILRISLAELDIVTNPEWVVQAAKNSRWTRRELDALLLQPEAIDVPEFGERLANIFATMVSGPLRPGHLLSSLEIGAAGIHNAAALFLPSDATFTKGAARDLAALAATPPARLRNTALAALLLEKSTPAAAPPLLTPVPLTPNQIEAAETALAGPVTAVTGPPGTGKTQVIVSVIASALADGKTVLVASRNHQALDAVEEKLGQLSGACSPLVRAVDRDGDANSDFARVVGEIVSGDRPRPEQDPTARLEKIRVAAAARRAASATLSQRTHIHDSLSDLVERRQAILDNLDPPLTLPSPGLLRRLWRLLTGTRKTAESEGTLAGLELQIAKLRRDLVSLPVPADAVTLANDVSEAVKEVFADLVAARQNLGDDYRRLLHRAWKDLELAGRTSAADMTEETARLVLAARPVWAITTLSVPARVPLLPGLFDYVIFDEASQCDIASALPLLARAKRAIIVGDDKQLGFIPQLSHAKERALFRGVGLPLQGMGVYMQSRNSLFDFCHGQESAARCFLHDQFRSASDIVSYINQTFYDGRLRGARNEDDLLPPPGIKPGLAWTDIKGVVTPDPAGGPLNLPEAKAIAEHVRWLLQEQGYLGSIGVISPFNSQVGLLQREVGQAVPQALRQKAELKIATVDGFQGGERDLILFSPVAAEGLRQQTQSFLQREHRRFNVAISRARAVAHVFGDLDYAKRSSVRHLNRLAAWATGGGGAEARKSEFDSRWERILYEALRKAGYDPTPQYRIAGRRLDFALFGERGIKLDVEVDGRRWHTGPSGERKVDDIWRDHQLRSLGWRVCRFWVHQLERDLGECVDEIGRELGRD